MKKRIIVAVTGASGAEIGLAVLKALRDQSAEIHLILSEGAKRVIRAETSLADADLTGLADFLYDEGDLGARIASGSFVTDGMIVVPCSMKTLSGIANAYDETLTVRAADICQKERRKLVLVPRESPLAPAHLRNMLTVSQDGAVVVPPVLSFYANADTVEKQVALIVGKVLSQFGMTHPDAPVWQGEQNG